MALKEALKPTPEDFETYKKEFPEEGVKLDKLSQKWEVTSTSEYVFTTLSRLSLVELLEEIGVFP